jgi:DNA-binding MarR family transcriptional regulator
VAPRARSKKASGARGDDARRTLDGIRRLVRLLLHEGRQTERAVGISVAQLFVLRQLASSPGLSLGDVAARSLTHQSTVSVVVKRLERAGFVARTRASDDARRLVLTVTAKGRAVLRRAPEPVQERLLSAIDALPPAERRRFAGTFESILAAIGGDHMPAGMLLEGGAGRRR